MTTTDLLRQALDADAEAAAAPEHLTAVRRRLALTPDDVTVVQTPARRPHRRLRLALSIGVAAVVAATVVSLFVASRTGSTPPPTPTATAAAAPTSLPPRWEFTVDPDPGGLTYAGGLANRDAQLGTWSTTGGGQQVAALQVSAAPAGQPVPARTAAATDVTVAGTRGWTVRVPDAATWTTQGNPFPGLLLGVGDSTLTVWNDRATGYTVSIVSDLSLTPERVEQLADTVRLGATRPIMVPFRATYVPQSTVLPWKMVDAPLPPELATTPAQFSVGDGQLGFFEVDVSPHGTFAGAADDPTFPQTAPTTIGRWTVTYRPGSLHTVLTDGTVDLFVSWGAAGRTQQNPESAIPVDELTRFLDGFTVANLDDPSTWFDFNDTIAS